MRRISSLFLVLVSSAAASPQLGSAAEAYPTCKLSSRLLQARLYLPDATNGYYRGTRFDWSGLISRVDWDGHTFFCEFKREHDPLNHDDICGTAEEFGIEAAPSYAQAKPGEPFIKIGIGVLERPDGSEYQFWRRYNILKPGKWDCSTGPDEIHFKQTLQGPNGWAYEYSKDVKLSSSQDPELKMIRRLGNIGSQRIDTDHYDHNFLQIDDVPAGTNYELEFHFAPRLTKDSKPQGCVETAGHSLRFTQEPGADKAVWVRVEGFSRPEDNWIKVVNHARHTAMIIKTDKPLSKLVFYSSGGMLCPEAFVKVDLAPGESMEWTTTYRFESDASPSRSR